MNQLYTYKPNDSEAEKASNGYLMSLVIVLVGMPLPILNLLATLMFYLANRKASWFVRWHCTQTLLSQFTLFFVNSAGFTWSMSILFGSNMLSDSYIAYMITLLLFNIFEFFVTMGTAIKVRKGQHVEWWFAGPLTNVWCRPKPLDLPTTFPIK